jgi:hypothetical protein
MDVEQPALGLTWYMLSEISKRGELRLHARAFSFPRNNGPHS